MLSTNKRAPSINFLLSQITLFLESCQFDKAAGLINLGLIYYPRHPDLVKQFFCIPKSAVYDPLFYQSSFDGSLRSASQYLKVFSELIPGCTTAIDVGGGLGAWAVAARMHGLDAYVMEGDWVFECTDTEISDKYTRRDRYIPADLQITLPDVGQSDLVICVEVAEHLSPERSVSFVQDLVRLGDACIFGAALPRQGGMGHINCRPTSYWVELFSQHGFMCWDVFRGQFWYNPNVEPWYAQNTFLYLNREKYPSLPGCFQASILDVYHPRVVLDTPYLVTDHLSDRRDPGY